MSVQLRTNETAINLIKDSESFQAEAYHCKIDKKTQEETCTIGYGSTFYQDGSPVKEGDRINEEDALELLYYHIKIAEDVVSSVLMVPVTNNEFSALVSFCYNVKHSEFKKSTLIRMLNSNAPREDVANQFLLWVHKSDKVLAGLVKRRNLERDLFLK